MSRWLFLAAITVLLVTMGGPAACAQATAVPTPTPTPTPTPIPTPTPTPTPPALAGFDPASMPVPDPGRVAVLRQLFSLVPSDYGPALFLDVQALQGNPELQRALQVDAVRLLATLPPGAIMLLESLVVALDEPHQGLVMALDGPIDVEALLQLITGAGISGQGPPPETYQGRLIHSIEVFGVVLAVGSADESTAVLATGSPAAAVPADIRVKGALDAYDGLGPKFLDNPTLSLLVDNLPPGLAAVVTGDCAEMSALTSIGGISGCAGAAASAELFGPNSGAINAVVAFQDEAQASAALPMVKQQGVRLGDTVIKEVAARQEGTLLHVRFPVDLRQISHAVNSLLQPTQ